MEELQPILSVCVERRGNIDRDISLAVVAIELRQIPVDEQALGRTLLLSLTDEYC